MTIEFDGRSLRLTPVREPMTLQSLMRGYEGPAPKLWTSGRRWEVSSGERRLSHLLMCNKKWSE